MNRFPTDEELKDVVAAMTSGAGKKAMAQPASSIEYSEDMDDDEFAKAMRRAINAQRTKPSDSTS
jgi:hypothetical protein